MRFLGIIVVSIFSVVGVSGFSQPVGALELPPGAISHEIHIKAHVKPARFIIIDDGETITEITSNTTQEVAPLVYLDRIVAGNERPLTDQLQVSFDQLVPPGHSKAGVLYKRPSLLSLMLQHSFALPTDLGGVPLQLSGFNDRLAKR